MRIAHEVGVPRHVVAEWPLDELAVYAEYYRPIDEEAARRKKEAEKANRRRK